MHLENDQKSTSTLPKQVGTEVSLIVLASPILIRSDQSSPCAHSTESMLHDVMDSQIQDRERLSDRRPLNLWFWVVE